MLSFLELRSWINNLNKNAHAQVAVALALALRLKPRRAARAPEAPGAVPGFGHLPAIGLGALPGVPGQQPHQRMGELQETWAQKGVLRLHFGASEVFLLSSPEAVEEALCGRNLEASAGRPSLPSVRLNGLSRGLSSSKADEERPAVGDPLVTASDFLGSAALRALRSVIARRRRRPRTAGDFLDAMLEVPWEEGGWWWGGWWVVVCDEEDGQCNQVVISKQEEEDAQKKYGFGEDLIVETLVSLTTAGISTVSTALEWLMLLLASDREVQSKARAGGEYLDACILEALRLKTPLFIPRRCMEAIQVAGFEAWRSQRDVVMCRSRI
eukprot:Skav215674  [mRNA]  locus=scaffold278:33396:42686:- [translate_table: standard]